MIPLIEFKARTSLFLLILACLALSLQAAAVCQQGCDLTNDNTFLGDDALLSNTTGDRNTAIGFQALFNNTSSGFEQSVKERPVKYWETIADSLRKDENSVR